MKIMFVNLWSMVKRFVERLKYRRRKSRVIEKCGCVCYCPKCSDILNDQADCTDTDLVRYRCNNCGHRSVWNFDIAPVALLLSSPDDKRSNKA